MDVAWLDPEKPDERHLAGLAAVVEAARQADTPGRRPLHVSSHRTYVRNGWDGDPPLSGVALDGSRVVARLGLNLPVRDNLHLCSAELVVDPLVRRRGSSAPRRSGSARCRFVGCRRHRGSCSSSWPPARRRIPTPAGTCCCRGG